MSRRVLFLIFVGMLLIGGALGVQRLRAASNRPPGLVLLTEKLGLMVKNRGDTWVEGRLMALIDGQWVEVRLTPHQGMTPLGSGR